MKKFRLSHIAVACPNVAATLKKLEVLSLKVAETHDVPTEKVRASMLPLDASKDLRLELLEPSSAESPISKFLEKRKDGGLHHLAFEVDDLEAWKKTLEGAGVEVLSPGIRKAARGRALFIHPKQMGGVLVELEEITGAH